MNIGKIGYGIHFPLMNSMEMAICFGQMHVSIRLSINRKQSNFNEFDEWNSFEFA